MREPFRLIDSEPLVAEPADQAMWRFLGDLDAVLPGEWVLVGGQMVRLLALEHGEEPDRATVDADALVNVRLVPDGTARVASHLEQCGLALEGIGTDGEGHRFTGNGLTIDVLAPDNLGRRARLTTIEPARTVEIPAGTRLLKDPHRVRVDCGDRITAIPRPDLDAAIVGKAAATTLASPERHRMDLVQLLGLVPDVIRLDTMLSASDRRWIRRAAPLVDEARLWRGRAHALAALRYLLR